MATAEVITIGTELLLGQQLDTNAAWMAHSLAEIGVNVHRLTSVGDNEARIGAAVREALARADAVVCCGGLGPTVDDMTREGISAATDRPLELHAPSLAQIRARFERFHRAMSANNERQALLPRGATAIENVNGSAPGFIIEDGQRVVVAVPGVPTEMRAMMTEHVIPFLKRRFGAGGTIVTRVLHVIDQTESAVDAKIADLFRAGVNPSIAVLAHAGQIDVKVTAKAGSRDQARELIAPLERQVRARLGDAIYGADDDTLEAVVGRSLRSHGRTISVAESCTGGLVAEMLTRVPGSSDYFAGGVVAYADAVKAGELDVRRELLEREGAVSASVCEAMARGVKARLKTHLGLAITGIAGPGGGSDEKPVGLVFIALCSADEKIAARRLNVPGDRDLVRRRAALSALSLVWRSVVQEEALPAKKNLTP